VRILAARGNVFISPRLWANGNGSPSFLGYLFFFPEECIFVAFETVKHE
jgi:hypothetical protein